MSAPTQRASNGRTAVLPLHAGDRAVLGVSFLGAAIWLGAMVAGRDTGPMVLVKGLAVFALAALAMWRQERLLAAALFFHGLGDTLIELQFLAGMAAFLVGHLVYAPLFLRHRRVPVQTAGAASVAALGLLGIAAMVALVGGLESVLAVAVPTYALALLAMAASAQLSSRGQPWLSIGAWLFVASDLLLAARLFGGVEFGSLAVWPTYWIAQTLITVGWLARDQGQVANAEVS